MRPKSDPLPVSSRGCSRARPAGPPTGDAVAVQLDTETLRQLALATIQQILTTPTREDQVRREHGLQFVDQTRQLTLSLSADFPFATSQFSSEPRLLTTAKPCCLIQRFARRGPVVNMSVRHVPVDQ